MAKNEKQEIKDGDVAFDFSNIGKAQEVFSKDSIKPEKAQMSFLFKIHQETVKSFNELFIKFLSDTQNYKHPSKAAFFSACVEYFNLQLTNAKSPGKDFYEFIQRPGKRPKSDRSFHRDNLEILFIKVDKIYFDMYVKQLYNYLIDKGDVFNPSYSVSYYFYDFMEMVGKDFKKIVEHAINN
jgi:hypothetical protein